MTSALSSNARLDPIACVLCHLHATESLDSPLVRHLLTSWQPALAVEPFSSTYLYMMPHYFKPLVSLWMSYCIKLLTTRTIIPLCSKLEYRYYVTLYYTLGPHDFNRSSCPHVMSHCIIPLASMTLIDQPHTCDVTLYYTPGPHDSNRPVAHI